MPKSGQIDLSYPSKLIQIGLELQEPFKGSKTHHMIKCLSCGHMWKATPLSKIQTNRKYGVSGCPQCNTAKRENRYKVRRKVALESLQQRGIQVLTPGYDGRYHIVDNQTYTKVLVKNLNCGHIFECSPCNLLTMEVECGICGPQKRVEVLTRWSKANSTKWKLTATQWQKYKATVSALTRVQYRDFKLFINPQDLPTGRAGTPGAYHIDHVVPVRYCFDNDIPESVCADHSNLQMIDWRANIGSRNHLKGSIPPIFHKYISSDSRLLFFAERIQKQVFPQSQLFFNVNGIITTLFDKLYNHAVLIIPLDRFHMSKKTALISMKQFHSAGVSFSIIFEDELVANHTLVHNKLIHYTKTNTSTRIHGRDCIISPVSSGERGTFLNQHHIQGNDNSQIAYGAYHTNELVAIMTFTAPRVALGYKNKDRSTYAHVWELSRFTTNIKYRIPGIASRLLEHFKRNNDWKEIYSYADRRWSVGNLYYKLGFQLSRVNPPDYFYVIDGVRKHRWNYRKDVLRNKLPNYDPTVTEYQNMLDHGYDRVWDCGTMKFQLTSQVDL